MIWGVKSAALERHARTFPEGSHIERVISTDLVDRTEASPYEFEFAKCWDFTHPGVCDAGEPCRWFRCWGTMPRAGAGRQLQRFRLCTDQPVRF